MITDPDQSMSFRLPVCLPVHLLVRLGVDEQTDELGCSFMFLIRQLKHFL